MHAAGRGRLQPGQGILNLLPLYLLIVIGVPTILGVAFVAYRIRRAGTWNTVIKNTCPLAESCIRGELRSCVLVSPAG